MNARCLPWKVLTMLNAVNRPSVPRALAGCCRTTAAGTQVVDCKLLRMVVCSCCMRMACLSATSDGCGVSRAANRVEQHSPCTQYTQNRGRRHVPDAEDHVQQGGPRQVMPGAWGQASQHPCCSNYSNASMLNLRNHHSINRKRERAAELSKSEFQLNTCNLQMIFHTGSVLHAFLVKYQAEP